MLSIKIHSPQSVYHPEDEVGGEVVYQPRPKDGPNFMITLEFWGHTETKINNGKDSTTRGYADLVRFQVATMDGPSTTCPFKFQFPRAAWPVDPSIARRDASTTQMTTVSPTHSLPPTFGYGARYGSKIHGNKGIVEYKLHATVLDGSRAICQEDLVLNFEPRVEAQSSHWYEDRSSMVAVQTVPMRVRTLHLVPENKDRKLKWSERTKSIFQKSKLPFFNFRVTTAQPTKINIGQNIPLSVRVEPLPGSSTAPEIPAFTLTRITIDIVATLVAYGGPSSHEAQFAIVSRRMEGFGDLEVSNFTKTITAAPIWGVVPSFSTFNMKYTHKLLLTGEIECAGEKVPMVKVDDITILPAVRGATPDAPYTPPMTDEKRSLETPFPYEELKPSLTRFVGAIMGSSFSLLRYGRPDPESRRDDTFDQKSDGKGKSDQDF